MRLNPTDAEQRLWRILRNRQLNGYKFRRQHSIGSYIVDFACVSLRIAVEADGGQHANSAKDAARTANIEKLGWVVVRFWNSDILGNTDGVLEALLQTLKDRHAELAMLKTINALSTRRGERVG